MKINSEKGLTLIELLATLTISIIILGSIYGVLVSVNKNYKNLSEKNLLRQEANLIVTTIKKTYLANSVFILKSYQGSGFIGLNESEPLNYLTNQNIKITSFFACNEEIIDANRNKCEIKNEAKNITTFEPLYLKITLSNDIGQTYEINTMINKY
ncbi:prepilin-type N-terminal cleavage/methylation domain-containing protein [Bacillus sp. JJ1503]|uniref:PilW family protein n=1 Tax=unclassified Bacillus (in: firmicutes) TaxID=185979 RepID=UPI002FFFEBB6